MRILAIAREKAGSKKEFADMMGWTAPYLSKLISGRQGIGLTPVRQILDRFRDIDARWLLFGEGCMFGGLSKDILDRLGYVLDLERYVPVMTEREQRDFIGMVRGEGPFNFTEERMAEWRDALALKECERDGLIRKAMRQSDEAVALRKRSPSS